MIVALTTRTPASGERVLDGRHPISLGDVLVFAMTADESTQAVAEAAIAQAQAATPAKVS